MRRNLLLSLLTCILLASCTKEIDSISMRDSHRGDIIHMPRRTPIPQQPTKRQFRALSPNAPDLRSTPYNTLGAVHGVGNGFLGHPLNIGNGGVIDIQSITSDNISSRFLFNLEPGFTTSSSEVHKNFESIRDSVNKTRKVTTGFALNLGLFSIGQTTTYNKVFRSNFTKNSDYRWANVNLYYYAKRIGIEKTEAAFNTISYRNVSDAFLYSIYSFPISNYIKEKGFLVVTDFFIGGRLSALVEYSASNKDHRESNDRDIDLKINGAFAWGDNKSDSVKANIGYENKKGNGRVKIENSENLSAKIDVYGGKPSGQIPNSVVDLKTASINIGDWYESLSDPSTHRFIDVADGGLVGIDRFMLETNFKFRVSMTLSGRLPYKTKLDIPYVEIRNVSGDLLSIGGLELAGITAASTILHTRQGDDIIILNKDFQERLNEHSFEEEDDLRERYKKDTKNLVDRLGRIFGCEIKSDVHNYNRVLERSEFLDVGLYIRLNFSFDKDKVYKYKNTKTNMWYIYDPEGMSALSYYDDPYDEDDDTYVTDMYGITDWVESIQTKKISMKTLSSAYRIVGL